MKLHRRRQASFGLLAAISVLAALALIYFAWPVYRAFLPLQIEHNESWNAYHADALRAGRPLYVLDYFAPNNYPPLSFYLLNAVSTATHVDVLYVGRMLSLFATAATTVAIWSCIRFLGASRLAATLGALWWFASMARWFAIWVGTDDPHLVALAIMTWALAYALRSPASYRAELAIVLMAVAGFYKNNLFAIPAVTLCWFTLHDWRRGLRLAFIGIVTVAAGLVLCGAIFGEAFFRDIFLPRHFDLSRVASIGRTQFIAPALVIAGIWAAYRRQSDASRFVMLFAAIALVSYIVQSLADGVADNAMFELTVATAIAIGCAFDDLDAIPGVQRWGLERGQIAVVCILIARLLISERVSPYLLLTSSDFRASLTERVAIMKTESARISQIPGSVACNIALACRFAGKSFVFDPFIVHEYVATGRLSEKAVAERVEALKIRFEPVDRRTSLEDLR